MLTILGRGAPNRSSDQQRPLVALCEPLRAAAAHRGAGTDDIVEVSRLCNAALGITGALLFNDQRFVQFLEGPEEAVTALRAKIVRDPRHHDLLTIAAGRQTRRRFQSSSLAYSGSSVFIASRIEAALSTRPRDGARLIELLQEFSAPAAG